MAEVTTQMVRELREATSAGILDCKKALTESDGNFEQAVDILRKKGLSTAAKKSDRETHEGIVGTYIHPGAKLASMVAVNCETDFVARTEQFQQLARDIAMHVAAANPRYVSREDVDEADMNREKEIFREQAASSGKPADIIERIVTGKIDKWYEEVCLLEQPFVKDTDKTVQALLVDSIAALGENIQIQRFERLAIGE